MFQVQWDGERSHFNARTGVDDDLIPFCPIPFCPIPSPPWHMTLANLIMYLGLQFCAPFLLLFKSWLWQVQKLTRLPRLQFSSWSAGWKKLTKRQTPNSKDDVASPPPLFERPVMNRQRWSYMTWWCLRSNLVPTWFRIVHTVPGKNRESSLEPRILSAQNLINIGKECGIYCHSYGCTIPRIGVDCTYL